MRELMEYELDYVTGGGGNSGKGGSGKSGNGKSGSSGNSKGASSGKGHTSSSPAHAKGQTNGKPGNESQTHNSLSIGVSGTTDNHGHSSVTGSVSYTHTW